MATQAVDAVSDEWPVPSQVHDARSRCLPMGAGTLDNMDEKMPLEECGKMLITNLVLLNAFSGSSGQISEESMHDGKKLARQMPFEQLFLNAT